MNIVVLHGKIFNTAGRRLHQMDYRRCSAMTLTRKYLSTILVVLIVWWPSDATQIDECASNLDGNHNNRSLPMLINSQCTLFENGEYVHRTVLADGTIRVESSTYEERNGILVRITRGFLATKRDEAGMKVVIAYVMDLNGFTSIPVPTNLADSPGTVRPSRPPSHHHHHHHHPAVAVDSDCDLSKGDYCIDKKLLTLMVG